MPCVVITDSSSYAARFDMIAAIVGDQMRPPNVYSPKDRQTKQFHCNHSTTSESLQLIKTNCHQVNIYGQSNQKRCYPLLINFGHRCCQISQKDNCETGLTFGMAQCVKLNMSIFNSDDGFRQRNSDILNRDRGAGYWLWKPYTIWHELYVAREGDIIVYSDA
ncbi:unnamed protein product, partial [Rotaria sp. Silwood1]